MQSTDETMQTLSHCFLQTLAPNPEPRKQAEAFLKQAAEQPGYGIAVLRIVSEPSVDEQVRQAAAVNFKNHVKYCWEPAEADTLPVLTPIQDSEKEQIKGLIVGLMLSTPLKIQSQLSEALAIISKHDFPAKWPTLLPELLSSLRSASDYTVINGVLQTTNSIFKQFRYQYKSDKLLMDLKYCLDNFAAPLLDVFLQTGGRIDSSADPPAILKPLFECQRLCSRIFFSLNFQELPEFFEDNMSQWMQLFHKYLNYSNPLLNESNTDKESIMDQLKSAICENINLYMEKNEEEFKDFLPGFAQDVWNLLMTVSLKPCHDRLATTAIKFLTTVSKSVHHELFKQPEALEQICDKIVIPNVRLRDDDEELFEMNHIEYIRRDMEGSDLDTRRRIACELVKGLSTHYHQEVSVLFSGYIQRMMSSYASNPLGNWKEKDCAIYLVISLAPKQSGGMATGTSLVDIEIFFASAILPELQDQDVNSQPVLKADALKFVSTFRSQLPKQMALMLMPQLARFLVSESNVVHSYAANCIEKFLVIKDGKQPRFNAQDISSLLSVFLGNLFNTLKMVDSQENVYVMKCIMRVLYAGEIAPFASSCLEQLVNILAVVCKNPSNPSFNHYLFEAIAAVVRRSCETNPEAVINFEKMLFPVFQDILGLDVAEFTPYVFQILSQLIETRTAPLPQIYITIFPSLLAPMVWQRSANVPALVRLLQAYLQKSANEIMQADQLTQVLGVFQKLVTSKNTDHQGFFILNTIVENLSYQSISKYITNIWTILFGRLQSLLTVKFVKSLIVFASLFVVKYGQACLIESINVVQPNIFLVILDKFWITNLSNISGDIETKLCAVAAVKLLCESPILMEDPNKHLWGRLLNSVLTLLVRPEEERVDNENEFPDLDEVVGYTPVYAQLHNAAKREDDPVKEVKDTKEFLAMSLAKLSSQRPGFFPITIQQHVEPTNQAALVQFCSSYRCTIV